MKYILKSLLLLVTVVAMTGFAFAQTPATPIPPEQQSTGLVPAEVQAAPAPAPQGTTLNLAPSITVKPLAVENLGNYGYSPYLGFEPSINFSADFLSGTGRKLGLSTGYTFIYKQYLTKAHEKYFEHDITFGLAHGLTDKLNMSVNGYFELDHFYSLLNQTDNRFDFEPTAGISYKITKEFQIGFKYYFQLFYQPNVIRTYDQIDPITNPPSDSSDIIKGTGGLYDYLGDSGYYTFIETPIEDGEPFKFVQHGVKLDLGYQFVPETKVSFKYDYFPFCKSNDDGAQNTLHQFYLVVNQQLWPGGSANLEYRFRMRNYPYSFDAIGDYKTDYRHRFLAVIGQAVNDFLSLELKYQLDHVRSNVYDPTNTHEFYLGGTFTF